MLDHESSSSFAAIIPGASTPTRTASGSACHVRTRSCRDTTKPATTPNAICDRMNQTQSMRWLSTGLTMSRMLWSRPDQKSGAMNPPSRIGRRASTAERYDYDYSGDELWSWAGVAERLAGRATRFFAMFNNHARGNTARNARTLVDLIGGGSASGESSAVQP